MVPDLDNQPLTSGYKFEEAGYVSVCNGDEANIYYGQTATTTVLEEVVLKV